MVEDDPNTTKLITLYLTNAGYHVLSASDGHSGLELAREHEPVLVILDLMLPGLDGLSVCRMLRGESDAFVIMLTARATEHDKLTGLETGADDYMVKPFSPRELTARVRAVLRRAPEESLLRGVGEELAVGDLKLSVSRQELVRGGTLVRLTAVEFRLLLVLMREPGHVFTRTQLVEKVFGHNYDGFDRTIDVHILKLRRKIAGDEHSTDYIQTVYGVGYKLEARTK